MSKEEFIDDLKELLSSDSDISLTTDLFDIDEWNSYSAMAFIDLFETKYNKKIDVFSIAEAVYVEDLFNIVKDF